MRDELLSQSQQAVDWALEGGADEAVVGISWGRSLDYQWRDDRLEKVQESTSRVLGVSLYVDGRYSRHQTNDLDPARLRSFLTEAVSLTRHLEADPFRFIPDATLYEGRSEAPLDLVDPAVVDLDREVRVDWCQRVDAEARSHEAVVSSTTGVVDGHSITARSTSNGFQGTRERTGIWYGSEVTVRDGEQLPEASRWVGALHLADLPAPEEVGREALRRALERRSSRKGPTSTTRLVTTPESGARLVGRILGALSASAIQQRRSFLADARNEEIASPLLCLEDQPLLPRGMASCHFDGEGLATRPRSVVSDGVLRSFFVDTYYGRKLGWEPTTGTPSNLVFRKGKGDLADALHSAGDGILVTDWLGGNLNQTSGDFSFGCQGRRISKGELGESLSEMNVSGNYLQLLRRLVWVGDDPEPWSTVRTPSLVFEDVVFSGS